MYSFTVTPKTAPPYTNLIELDMTVGAGTTAVRLKTGVGPRASAAGLVATQGSGWVLHQPVAL